MISELKLCQEANGLNNSSWGVGYVGGVPNSAKVWSTLKDGNLSVYRRTWAPWYNVHKMYAGLRDAWLYAGDEEAKTIFLKFCDWAIDLTSGLSDSLMQAMLDSEHGGMPEMFADAYQMTGDEKYITTAKRFSHRALLDPMAAGIDDLDNKHANTQIPKVIGFQRIAELTGDSTFRKAARFFWETVTDHRSLAFGGNSRKEHFPSKSSSKDFIDDVEGPESCNSYNMLKLTEDLFRAEPEAHYVDYYERTMYNHILSTQNPVTGGYVYFTPARPRSYRVYSTPNEAMWCCVGTGMENHSKYNEFIFTHSGDSLYVNLFVASELHWRDKGITLRQETKFPDEDRTRLTVTDGTGDFALLIRYPFWVAPGMMSVTVNGKPISIAQQPSSYVAVDRNWSKGDVVEVVLPMHTRIEHLPYVPEYVAFMHGPILLAAKTGTEDLAGLFADDSRWGQTPSGKRFPLDTAPILIEDTLSNLTKELVSVKDKPLEYTIPHLRMINPISVLMEPFYKVHNARYMMYWMALTNNGYHSYLDSLVAVEKARLDLENRTIDQVDPGEQQPETDHHLESEKSRTGNLLDEFWRDASDSGYFSYEMRTNGKKDVSLRVRYFGYEWGSRIFDIYIDGQKLISENTTGRWFRSKFEDVEYQIPADMVSGKDHIRVKFQAAPHSTAGAVYGLRLVESK